MSASQAEQVGSTPIIRSKKKAALKAVFSLFMRVRGTFDNFFVLLKQYKYFTQNQKNAHEISHENSIKK